MSTVTVRRFRVHFQNTRLDVNAATEGEARDMARHVVLLACAKLELPGYMTIGVTPRNGENCTLSPKEAPD